MAQGKDYQYQYQYQFQERDYVEVNARASREVTPDEIFLQIVLDQNQSKGKYTIDQLESRLFGALKKAGVDAEKELKVSDMSSQLKDYLLRRDQGRITKQFTLKVTNEQIMPVFRELENVEITDVNVISSRYSKVKELYEELLAEAVATAKRRAGAMVAASADAGGGEKVGKLIFVQAYDNTMQYEGGIPAGGVMYKAVRAEAVTADMLAPTFEFNEQRIEASVTARFAIE
jgi:uncharacterized protein YggE